MGLNAVQRTDAGDLRPPEGVGDDLADVREDVGLPLAAVELGLQRERGGAVPPAGYPDGWLSPARSALKRSETSSTPATPSVT